MNLLVIAIEQDHHLLCLEKTLLSVKSKFLILKFLCNLIFNFISLVYYRYFQLKIPEQTVHGRLIVCDVTSIYTNDCINNSRKQLDSLTSILESLKKLKASDNFLLIGYPLLSQVNVGIFYVLVNIFLKVIKINYFIIYNYEYYIFYYQVYYVIFLI
jgi:hypothetical protein